MSIYYPDCPESQADHDPRVCGVKEKGDVRALVFQSSAFSFTPGDLTITSEWEQGISDRDLYVFPYTKGTVEVTPNTSEGFGDVDEQIDSYTYTMNVTIPGYKENAAFVNDMKNRTDHKILYKTEKYLHQSEVSASIKPTNPVNGKTDRVDWLLAITWTQDNTTIPMDAPTGVFDRVILPTP